jgi:hypothetical protein
MKTRLVILIVFFLNVFVGCAPETNSIVINSPVVNNDFQKLTTHKELMAFIEQVDSLNENIQVEILRKLEGEYVLPVVKIATKDTASQKVRIMILAQQHGDEPSGKEAVLELVAGFANSRFDELLDNVELYILPQVNPWGGDNNERRNSNDLDLNRDHLLLKTREIESVHRFFHKIKPHVTIDVHEYNPYYQEWTDFGYYKNADVQLGGITNPVAEEEITELFYNSLLPAVQKDVEANGHSFLEYTLGQIYNEEGRLRHSTVHIDDGRQSFGLMQTLSMIIEGKNGHTTLENLKKRTESQYTIMYSILKNISQNSNLVVEKVERARNHIIKEGLNEKFGVRFTHVQNRQKLSYPLWSIEHERDTIFSVDKYYPDRIITESIDVPFGYLVPSNDSILIDWMDKQQILYNQLNKMDDLQFFSYLIKREQVGESFEEWEFKDLDVDLIETQLESIQYVFVPIKQWAAKKIILAFEPRSMLGIFNETTFTYLLQKETYPILKAIQK